MSHSDERSISEEISPGMVSWFITLEESRVFLETLQYHLWIVEEIQLCYNSAAKLKWRIHSQNNMYYNGMEQ